MTTYSATIEYAGVHYTATLVPLDSFTVYASAGPGCGSRLIPAQWDRQTIYTNHAPAEAMNLLTEKLRKSIQ